MAKEKKETKKSPKKKPGRVMTTAQKIKSLDEVVIDKILEDKKEEMSVEALKIAREMAARMDLEIQKPLDELQDDAALLYAVGNSIDNVAKKIGTDITTITEWMKSPAFMKKVNEYIYSKGNVEKGQRIRLANKRSELLNDVFFAKAASGELENLPITTIAKMIVDSNAEVASLVDKKEDDKGAGNIQVMIINHFKSKGHEYKDLDDFFEDPEFDFRKKFIDIESEEV